MPFTPLARQRLVAPITSGLGGEPGQGSYELTCNSIKGIGLSSEYDRSLHNSSCSITSVGYSLENEKTQHEAAYNSIDTGYGSTYNRTLHESGITSNVSCQSNIADSMIMKDPLTVSSVNGVSAISDNSLHNTAFSSKESGYSADTFGLIREVSMQCKSLGISEVTEKKLLEFITESKSYGYSSAYTRQVIFGFIEFIIDSIVSGNSTDTLHKNLEFTANSFSTSSVITTCRIIRIDEIYYEVININSFVMLKPINTAYSGIDLIYKT